MSRRCRPRKDNATVFLVTKAGRAAGPHARPWTPRHHTKTPAPARTVLGEPVTPNAADTCGTESKP